MKAMNVEATTGEPTAAGRLVADLLHGVRAVHPIRAPSLIITCFGDVVSQHGGVVWLGSLVRMLEPLGLGEHLVRTAAYRLVQDGWLVMHKHGRRSYYAFSSFGTSQFTRAAHRIYAAARPTWDGRWTLVLLDGVAPAKRELLRKVLLWQGYGPLLPRLYAHPASDRGFLDQTLGEMDLLDKVVVWDLADCQPPYQQVLLRLVASRWNVTALATDYRAFLNCFERLRAHRDAPGTLGAACCFRLRLLLIHEYRRILLKDPDLPPALLAPQWPGLAAQNLLGELYRAFAPVSLDYIAEHLVCPTGAPPPAAAGYSRRFGGLDRATTDAY